MDVPASASEQPVQIDWCPIDRVEELQQFIDKHWKANHVLARDRELLLWQYRYIVRPDRLSVLVATRGAALLGFLGVIRFDFNKYGLRRPAGWLATWYVLPSERDRRIGMMLLRDVFGQGFGMVGCLGMNDKGRMILAAHRFGIHDSVPRWVRPGSPAALASLLEGRPAPPRRVLPAAAADDRIEVIPWAQEIAASWDKAWLRRCEQWVSVWRDSDYLRWRYVEHPRFTYTLEFARDRASGELLGYAAYRIETIQNRTERVLRVVEFFVESDGGPALAAAIARAVEEHGVAFADFYCTSPQLAVPLEAVGFEREQPQGPMLPTLFQPLEWQPRPLNAAFWDEHQEATLFDHPNVYFTRADGDQDRPN